MTGNVYGHASGSAAGTTISLPDSIAGYTGALSGRPPAPRSPMRAGAYAVNLKTTGGGTAGGRDDQQRQRRGAGRQRGPSPPPWTARRPSAPGSLNQTFNLTYADDSTLPGAGSNLGGTSIVVTGNVWGHASGSADAARSACPTRSWATAARSPGGNATVSNATAGAYAVNLKTSGGGGRGGRGDPQRRPQRDRAGQFGHDRRLGHASPAGNGRRAGALNQTFNLTYADDSTLPGASSNLGGLPVVVTGNVWGHASGLTTATQHRLWTPCTGLLWPGVQHGGQPGGDQRHGRGLW